MTKFVTVYNRFLNKITDDMYMELTPQDTIKDLQKMLINSLPEFEFPRKNLFDFVIDTEIINEEDLTAEDFVLGVVWDELLDDNGEEPPQKVVIEHSYFNEDLTEEEINILALMMQNAWLQRQITSIENIRMKYSGSDFKFTSQANHLSKLLTLQTEIQRQCFHMQRLYRRRRFSSTTGLYESNWSVLREKSAID